MACYSSHGARSGFHNWFMQDFLMSWDLLPVAANKDEDQLGLQGLAKKWGDLTTSKSLSSVLVIPSRAWCERLKLSGWWLSFRVTTGGA